MELNEIHREILNCDRCELVKLEINRRKLLPRKGRKNYLIVSQNPSYYHSPDVSCVWGGLNNLPLPRFEKFLLDNGLMLEDFHISNVIKCSFKNNVVPKTVEEIREKCSCWLEKEIETIKPKFIVSLGKLASEFFDLRFGETGYWKFIPVVADYHPNYVARMGIHDEFFEIFGRAFRWL